MDAASFPNSSLNRGLTMDPNAIAGMAFTLILALFIGGFVLLFPLSRKLGQLLEQRMGVKPQLDDAAARELSDLRQLVEGMQADLGRLRERQEFVEHLLAEPKDRRTEKLNP